MKNRPLLIIALAAIVIVWALYKSLGGVEEIRRDPAVSLGAIGIPAHRASLRLKKRLQAAGLGVRNAAQ